MAMPEQIYYGNDIFAGEPEPPPLPRSRPQQPNYYGPNINPFPGPPPPQRGIPYGTPNLEPPRYAAPPPTPMRPNYAAPPRSIPPSAPLGPPGGFSRQLTPSAVPQQPAPGPGAGNGVPPQELLRMLQLISGGFGGGTPSSGAGLY
jgi:hypothetical protein